jgi:hypothetical protein
MSQIPRAQYAVKKRQSYTYEVEHQNGNSKVKKSGNVVAEKIADNFDNDVLIIDENLFDVVENEVVITTEEIQDSSPGKRKRNRKSKDSTESKDSEIGKSPSSRKSSTNGSSQDTKIKTAFDDFAAKQRRSRADRLQNASTIVNLSTVSTSESTIRDETLDSNATPTGERRTSGRRSARPIDEIKFEYRTTTDLDDSLNATTNATIGSEANDSLLTTPGTDRKRHLTDSNEAIDSPKRSRIDLSGLFNSFSSPVTLLRNKFRRTNIASTPVIAGDVPAMNDSMESLEEIKSSKEDETPIEKEEKEEELEVITTPISKKKACIVM